MLTIAEWGATEWEHLFSHTEIVDISAGSVLIHQESGDRALYFVVSGQLDMATFSAADGSISPITSISAGSVVGELAFFDGQPRSGKVWASKNSRLLRYTLDDYNRYVQSHPSEALLLLFGLAKLLSARVRRATSRTRGR